MASEAGTERNIS